MICRYFKIINKRCVWILKNSSVVSNIEPLDTRSFSLGKLCVRARSRFEKVIFCVLILARNSNARQTFICYLMKLFENVRKSNVRWCSCSKMLENRRSYSLDTRKIRVRHNTNFYTGHGSFIAILTLRIKINADKIYDFS